VKQLVNDCSATSEEALNIFRGFREPIHTFREHQILLSKILRCGVLSVRHSPELLADFAVHPIAANEDVATERGAIFTHHNYLLSIVIDAINTFGYSDFRLVFKVFVQDAEEDLAVKEGSGVVEAA
jgi:hypothetical protein